MPPKQINRREDYNALIRFNRALKYFSMGFVTALPVYIIAAAWFSK